MSDPTTVPTPTADAVEFGINTFGDVSSNLDGTTNTHAHTIREIVEQGALADELGIDVIGIGEHHRDDFAVSSPELVLAAIASRTEHIRLASAVTVLSSDDPVRLFERWSTLDAVSNGRAEIMIGRGSFTESFPLFGFEMHDYEELFEEKANLWSMLAQGGPVTWRGKFRAPLTDTVVYPPIEPNADGTPGRLATSVAVGGSPESVIRAAHYDFPLMLAIIGGEVSRFAPFADLYRRAQAKFEHDSARIGYHSPGFIGATDAEAKDARDARAVRGRDSRRRRAPRRQPRDGRAEDRAGPAQPRRDALRPQVPGRPAAARARDAVAAALWRRGDPAGARAARRRLESGHEPQSGRCRFVRIPRKGNCGVARA
jgi:alkanesulfonate monooxygenase SsuD/methylene tetrahydromethanopterin reductase-like flavin-dependent oxidoreductase (luciferase family)